MTWTEAIITYLKTTATKHILFIAVVVAGFFIGRAYLAERDARAKAEATVKTAQTQIDTLAKQQTATAQAAKVQITVLQKAAEAVQTAPQAVKALETDNAVKDVLPSMAVLPDAPGKVSVDALELFKGVNKCEQDAVTATSCTQELTLQKQIATEKDGQIAALKKKPSFWTRAKNEALTIGISAAVGYVAAKR